MNRHNNLLISLHTWIDLPIKEIIIIDWCSDIIFSEIIPEYLKRNKNFNKIKIYRVKGYNKWILTWAFNLGLYLANSKYILKVDADVTILSDFFIKNILNDNDKIFYRGYWNKHKNKHLNGQFFCKKEYLEIIGYFNEYITTYGYDDCDLYKRLNNLGIVDKMIFNIDHLYNDDHSRIKYQDVKNITYEIEYNKLKSENNIIKFDIKRYKKIDEYNYELLEKDDQYFNKKLYDIAYKKYIKEGKISIFTEKKFIVLKVFNGTGNRLRAMLSILLFSIENNYKLYVIWEKTKGYDDSHFYDFFNFTKEYNNIEFIKNKDIENLIFEFKYNFIDSVRERINIEKLLKYNKIYIESSNYLNNIVITKKNYYNFENIIKPSSKIMIILDYIFKNFKITNYNIFHIRRGDAVNLNNKDKENYKISSIYMFAKYINESKINNIVVTDDYEYCDRFLNILCPNKYIIINRTSLNKHAKDTEEKKCVLNDMLDFFILSMADKIYATNWSSFSYIASEIFNIPIFIVKDTNKFALFKYNKSNNIGDYIQSIAIKQYLPYVNDYIDRDNLSNYNNYDNINLILAGWFCHSNGCTNNYYKNSKMCVCDIDNNINWPPSKNINPLFISFNISNNNMLKYLDYIKKYEPIGCRDMETLNKLKRNNIEGYFSSCATLTLKKNHYIQQINQILVIDVSKEIAQKYINNDNNQKIIYDTNVFSCNIIEQLSEDKKFEIAEETLLKIQKSKLVITSRLHILSPCLAYDIPVIFIDINDDKVLMYKYNIYPDSYSPSRYNDIKEFINDKKSLKITQNFLEENIIKSIFQRFYM